MSEIKFVSAEYAAKELNTTLPRILMMLKNGDLVGEQLDGVWQITGESLACAKVHGSDLKTVNKCASYCSSGGCGCK